MTDRAENLPKLSRLGRFEILSELGKGAMGVVYLAKDPSIGRLVAIKTIRASGGDEDDSESREFRERFMREAQTAGILSHPNIVTIYDVGEDTESGVSFIAMEYIEGKTIKSLLGDVNQFPSDQIADIIGQVAEALDYAHRKGIIHRDIKPANIMITTDGKVKITDFGIAKVASSNLTTTGQFLGTPNYMSPEQVTGASVDGRSDIFSLGVVLYEMLSRRKPFSGENLTTISYKIVHESFAPVADPSRNVPAEFDAILAKALSKDPWNRYQRGKDFALALYQAKARFEEQAIFQDLGTMVSSAENLPGLKLESMDDMTRQDFGTAPGLDDSMPVKTIAMPVPSDAGESTGGAARGDASVPGTARGAPGEDRPGSGEIAAMASETSPSAKGAAARSGRGQPNLWRAAVNPKYWWGIVAVAILLTGAVILVLKMRIPKVQEQRLVEAANRAQVELQKEVQHGKDLYEKGQYNESLAVFRGILQRDPSVKSAREYSQMAEEALRNEQAKKADDEKAVARAGEIADHLQKGRAALGEKNFDVALSESEAVLNLDAKNEEATRLSEDTRKALAGEKKAGLKKADKKTERDKKKKAETLARAGQPQAKPLASSTASASTASKPVATANTPATVHVNFNSPISKGYLMIAVNDSIIFRKNFDFGNANGGVVSDSLHAAPGNATIKVWLTTPDSSIKGYQAISATFSGGDSKTLTLTLQGTKFTAHLS
jgi:serine/threonine-protein kinase